MSSRVEERDLGWERIQKEIRKASGAAAKVGVLGDSGSRLGFKADSPRENSSDADMLLVAAANEFGTSAIPARPFIRGAFDQHNRELSQTAERLWQLVLRGKMTMERALALMGEQHQGQVQEYMTALRTPDNAPRTIAQKGSSNPLISEGRLRNSIRYEVENV